MNNIKHITNNDPVLQTATETIATIAPKRCPTDRRASFCPFCVICQVFLGGAPQKSECRPDPLTSHGIRVQHIAQIEGIEGISAVRAVLQGVILGLRKFLTALLLVKTER